MARKARSLPENMDGPEEWSGWHDCEYGYPLVNFVRHKGRDECAYLTLREMGLPLGPKIDVARARMVAALSRLRESVTPVPARSVRARHRHAFRVSGA